MVGILSLVHFGKYPSTERGYTARDFPTFACSSYRCASTANASGAPTRDLSTNTGFVTTTGYRQSTPTHASRCHARTVLSPENGARATEMASLAI